MILDYIRYYGEDAIGGVQFVGAVTKLGSEEALSVMTPELLTIFSGLLSTNVSESVASLGTLLRLCFANELCAEDHFRMLGYSLSVPPYVRQGLFSRTLSNDDLLPNLRKPMLITHGERDAVVKPVAATKHKAAVKHAELDMMQGIGHACFWDDAAAFNLRQRAFVTQLNT